MVKYEVLRGKNNRNRSSTTAKYKKPTHFLQNSRLFKDFTGGKKLCTCTTTFQDNKTA